jgi:hypothetical protein
MDAGLERKYLLLVADRLEGFKQKSGNLWQARCCYCGDSQKNKKHAHLYVYEKNGNLFVKCQRCGFGTTVPKLVERLDDRLYSQMRLESLSLTDKPSRSEPSLPASASVKPVFRDDEVLRGMTRVSRLPDEHPVRRLVLQRRIPSRFHHDLYHCPAFMAHTNALRPGKFSKASLKRDEARLVIPVRDAAKRIVGYQGRVLGKRQPKYITIALADAPMLFGLERLDSSRTFYALEGPFDSMFAGNAVATCGGDIAAAVRDLPRERAVVAYDCERRHPQTVAKMERAIDGGFGIVVWPRSFEHKDLNEAVMSGWSVDRLQAMLEQSTYRGLAARAALSDWSLV